MPAATPMGPPPGELADLARDEEVGACEPVVEYVHANRTQPIDHGGIVGEAESGRVGQGPALMKGIVMGAGALAGHRKARGSRDPPRRNRVRRSR